MSSTLGLKVARRDSARYPNNILRVYQSATRDDIAAGMNWYGEARTFAASLAAGTPWDVETVAAVISAVSPRSPWGRNKLIARELVRRYRAGELYFGLTLNSNAALAYEILGGTDPYTLLKNKRLAFWRNITGDMEWVTIDGHALTIATGDESVIAVAEKAYPIVTDAYRIAADMVGIAPANIQAATWVARRRARYTTRHLVWLETGIAEVG